MTEWVLCSFTLPLAMVVICLTFIPIYHKYKVYTYEYLEKRFENAFLAAILFLFQRGLGTGITIYAPQSSYRRY
jgi:hypothetical protein